MKFKTIFIYMISILCDSAVYTMQQKYNMCKESILFIYGLFNDVTTHRLHNVRWQDGLWILNHEGNRNGHGLVKIISHSCLKILRKKTTIISHNSVATNIKNGHLRIYIKNATDWATCSVSRMPKGKCFLVKLLLFHYVAF